MPRSKKTSTRVRWTSKDVATLRKAASSRAAGLIAKDLGRTEAAVRYKAHIEGISFRAGKRGRKAAKKK